MIAGRDGRRRAVVAVDRAAQALGVRPGLALAQAQARVPDLHIEPADPAADAAALARLALWALRRYSPVVAIDLPDGLLIDATGVAHLFGGETALLDELRVRLTAARLGSRVALAGTVGAAHALARFGPRPAMIVASGETDAEVASLPLAALRLDPTLVERLRRLGFESIADLAATPRAPLALRFGSEPGPPARPDVRTPRRTDPADPLARTDSGSPRLRRADRRAGDTGALYRPTRRSALPVARGAGPRRPAPRPPVPPGRQSGAGRSVSAPPNRCARSSD